MPNYIITVYEKDGTKLVDETIEAENDREGRKKGEAWLVEHGYENHTSRVTSTSGKLIHFHR
jgi:hypothetical protein